MDLTSNEPFWLVKNGLVASYPSLADNIKTDVLIVGGGITGSLMAHKCIADGYNTVLIDRREIANGSTSATTSMLQYEIDVPLFELIEKIGQDGATANYWACHDSIDELGDIVRDIKSDCGYDKKESLYFAAYKKHIPMLQTEFEARKAAGLPVQWLTEDQIKRTFQLERAYAGILSKQGGSLDAFKFTHDVLAYNCDKGLQVFDKTDIKKTMYHNKGVTITTDYGNTIKAKTIIYCNGYESTELIKDNFVKLLSTYAIVGERLDKKPKHLSDTLIWNTADPYLYLRTTDDHRILIGGEDEDFVDDDKRDALIFEKQSSLQKKLKRLLPKTNFRPDFAWAGTFGETKDGLPYIGKHPSFPSSYFVLGFGGNGITFSVIGANVVSSMMKGNPHPLEAYYKFRR